MEETLRYIPDPETYRVRTILTEAAPNLPKTHKSRTRKAEAAPNNLPKVQSFVVDNLDEADSGKYEDFLFTVGGWGNYPGTNAVQKMNCKTEVWSSASPMSWERIQVGVCVLKNCLYVIGGHQSGVGCVSTIERYNPCSNSWSSDVPSMEIKRENPGVAVLEEFIYVCGGGCPSPYPNPPLIRTLLFGAEVDERDNMKKLERFDLVSNEWTILTSMSISREGLGFESLGGFLYAIGGRDREGPTNTMERYSPQDNLWISVSSTNTKREKFGCTVYQGCIYAAGGVDEKARVLSSVERYDAVKDEWSCVAPMNTRRSCFGLGVGSGKLFAVGGMDRKGASLKSIEVFDVVNNSWRTAEHSINSENFSFGLATLKLKKIAEDNITSERSWLNRLLPWLNPN